MTKNTLKHPPPPPPVIKSEEGGQIQFPNKNDVLSGRGGRINNHEGNGNVYFRKLVAGVKVTYISKRKLDKAWIAADIVDQIRKLDPPGRFLKEDPGSGLWQEVGDERARRKTGQALREDAPDLREEMEVQDRSNYMMTAQQHPYGMMPMDPIAGGMYPGYAPMPYPPGAMYYPQMYPPQYPGQYPLPPPPHMPQAPPSTMPQAAGPAGAAPFPAPTMNPYMYPPAPMYPAPVHMPVVTPPPIQPRPPTQAQAQQAQPQQQKEPTNAPGEVSTSLSTTKTGSSNFTGISDISADTDLLALMGSEEHQKKLDIKEQKNVPKLPAIKIKVDDTNTNPKRSPAPVGTSYNSTISQLTTDTQAMFLSNLASSVVTATALPIGNQNHSSTTVTCDNTEELSEYQHNIKVPIKDPAPHNTTTHAAAPRAASSRRNQWREQLKQNVSHFTDLLPPNQHKQQAAQEPTSQEYTQKKHEFLPMEEDISSRSLRLSSFIARTNGVSNRASNSSSSKSSGRWSNNYLFSSSIMSELSLASQNLPKDSLKSFRKSSSMTDLDAHTINTSSNNSADTRGSVNRGHIEDFCLASTTMDKSMAESTASSWVKGYNPLASDLNPWMSESNRSMFSEISMDLLALDLAGDNFFCLTSVGNKSVIMDLNHITTKQGI